MKHNGVKMKKIVLMLLVMALGGCATADFNYKPQTMNVSEPPLGAINIAYVGDTMLRQGKYSENDAIYLPTTVSVGWAYDLLPGYYLKKGEDSNSETYMPSLENDGGSVDKAALADPWQAVMAYKDKPKLCVISVFSAMVCENDANFKRMKKAVLTTDSFQQTLIYSGKVGDKINIGYREFSANLARPAFNNDVEYDLSASNIIGYKGAKIEIIEATNEQIKYRVIKNFNRAQM